VRIIFTVASGALALALAACSAFGSGGGTPDGFTPPATARAPLGAGRTAPLTITLPAIQPAREPVDWLSKSNRLSAATRSVSGSIAGVRFGPIALSSSLTGCGATSGGLSCSIAVRAPTGLQEPLVLATYATANGKGPALATSTASVDVVAGRQNFAAPPVLGIARAIAVGPVDGVVHQGTWQPEPIVAYGIDATGAPIPSTLVAKHDGSAIGSLKIVLSGFVNQTVTGPDGPYACCGILPLPVAYDGRHAGTETFTVTASGFPAHSTSLRVLPGPATPGTIIAKSSYSDSPNSIDYIAQYSANAQGNAAPVRTFLPPASAGAVFGEDLQGNFWSGGTHLTNAGAVIGTVDLPYGEPVATDSAGNLYALGDGTSGNACAVYEYRAHRYGRPAPIREIDFDGCPNNHVAVDRSGNVFVSFDSQGAVAAHIYEYGPSGSGAIAPVRTIVMPLAGSYDAFSGIDTDAAGNLYALFYPGMDALRLLQFAPGSTSPKRLLAGTAVQSFAVDDGGGIYARVYAASEPSALEFFPAGASKPSQIIAGPRRSCTMRERSPFRAADALRREQPAPHFAPVDAPKPTNRLRIAAARALAESVDTERASGLVEFAVGGERPV